MVSGASGMPPFRERLGTGCTKDSKDSGIEMQTKSSKRQRKRKNMQTIASRSLATKLPTRQKARIEDDEEDDVKQSVENIIVIGLWLLVLYLTNTAFGLPFQIMWPARINHVAVAFSYLLISIWALCALYFYIRKSKKELRWYVVYPKTYYFAWTLLFIGMAIFCLATYPQIEKWCLLVASFYYLFFVTVTTTYL